MKEICEHVIEISIHPAHKRYFMFVHYNKLNVLIDFDGSFDRKLTFITFNSYDIDNTPDDCTITGRHPDLYKNYQCPICKATLLTTEQIDLMYSYSILASYHGVIEYFTEVYLKECIRNGITMNINVTYGA